MSVHHKETTEVRELQIVSEIVQQHAERVAFLWAQRDTLSTEDPPDTDAVAAVDDRLEIDLDGIRVAGPAAWPHILALADGEPGKGALFLFAWAAIEFADASKIEQAVERGRSAADDARGLIGALAWRQPLTIAPLVQDWIGSHDGFRRFLAVSACIEHNFDPKQMLSQRARDPDPRVRAVSLRLAGMLGRADLMGEMRASLDDAEERVKFWAAWSLTELGAGDLASPQLRKVAVAEGGDALAALRAAVKASSAPDARGWMGSLRGTPHMAVAVRGVGMLGDRTALRWLTDQMGDPALAGAAGAALLELFPEARAMEDLFTNDPSEAGQKFEDHFGHRGARIPLADKVREWGLRNKHLPPS